MKRTNMVNFYGVLGGSVESVYEEQCKGFPHFPAIQLDIHDIL